MGNQDKCYKKKEGTEGAQAVGPGRDPKCQAQDRGTT